MQPHIALTFAVLALASTPTLVKAHRARALVTTRSPSLTRARVVSYKDGTEDDDLPTPDVFPPTPEEDTYDEMHTLLRHGPIAFFHRVISKGEYERGIEMFALRTGCSKKVAQGNIDAALADPNSWVFNKLHADDTKEPDYANVNSKPHQLALTAAWGLGVTSLIVKAACGVPIWLGNHPDWQDYCAKLMSGIPNIFH